ncbi:MAG: cation:proton antiporter subunit C [Arenicellales bacterium]
MTEAGQVVYWVVVFLMMAGLYIVVSSGNLIKKVVGLNIFQTSVFVLYISLGKLSGGAPPIFIEGVTKYVNPLPSVLILTAIVVGVATSAVALALAVRIHEAYGSVEEADIERQEADRKSGGDMLRDTERV